MNSPMGAFSFLGQDASVLKKKVKPGTATRTLAFAVPYSGLLALFLLIVILGAGISIASPLIYRQIINDGILKGNSSLIIQRALLVAALGGVDVAMGVLQLTSPP